jgi:tryptophanyl-tRNA synthetase
MRDRGTPFRGIRAIFLAIRNAVPPGLKGDAVRFDTILKQGGERAGVIAEKTMNEVRDIIGFLR